MMKTSYFRKGQPHFQDIGASFSLTVMVHDAIPMSVIQKLQEERKTALAEINIPDIRVERELRDEIATAYEAKLEGLLHQKSAQEHPFRNKVAAQEILNTILKYRGQYYKLAAATVMSNHFHALLDFSIQVPDNWDGLSEIKDYKNVGNVIGEIKGRSAFMVNRLLGRKGSLWRIGYYDRYIRSEKHFENTLNYITHNPVKSGLVENWKDHPYTWVNEKLLT